MWPLHVKMWMLTHLEILPYPAYVNPWIALNWTNHVASTIPLLLTPWNGSSMWMCLLHGPLHVWQIHKCLPDIIAVIGECWTDRPRYLLSSMLNCKAKYQHVLTTRTEWPIRASQNLFDIRKIGSSFYTFLLNSSMFCLFSPRGQPRIRNLVPALEKARAYRGRGGEVIRQAACRSSAMAEPMG